MWYFGIIFVLTLNVLQGDCHPQCLDFYAPFETKDLAFCSMYNDISCCTLKRDREIQQQYIKIIKKVKKAGLSKCFDYVRDILCQKCSPYAAHLYDAESTGIATLFPGLCTKYCVAFHKTCSNIIYLLTTDKKLHEVAKLGTDKFCKAVEIPDMDYCYPEILDDSKLNSALDRALGGKGDGCLCLEEFATGLRNPLLAVHANDSTHRLYIAEQLGIIHIYLKNGDKLDEPFLDLQKAVLTSDRRADERGLLGLAFHPKYKENKRLFIHYTTTNKKTGNTMVRVSEFSTVVGNDLKVDTQTERVLFEVDEPAVNHNGGQILFGYDGYLYISLGDGGKGGDPWGKNGNAQNMMTFLGKILRIDVDSNDKPYGIPPSNPFVNRPKDKTKHEIYAYGIRNIWRCGLDRGDRKNGYGRGRIICGDVGQSKYEEIDIIVKGGNYGWRAKEAYECYDKEMCAASSKWLANEVLPIHSYDHKVGKSVTGGHIYRGCLFPNMNGYYIYGDFLNGRLFKLVDTGVDGKWENSDLCLGDSKVCTGSMLNTYPTNILSFGEDESGEIYMLTTDVAKTSHAGGKVYRFVDPALRRSPSECSLDANEIKGTVNPNKNIGKTAQSVHKEEIKEGDGILEKTNDMRYYISKFELEAETSHFVPLSLSALFFIITTYILYSNRHKIFSLVFGGRAIRGNFRRLNQNLNVVKM